MRAEVAHDLSTSSLDFMREVVPAISHIIGGGVVEPVECSTSSGMMRNLDMLAGIDAWQVITDEGMRGLASRVQWGDRCWDTFTIREHRPSGAVTELEKRQRGRDMACRGYVHPHLTVHAYLTKPRGEGHLIGVGVARTDDLLDYVELYLEATSGQVPSRPDWSGVWRQVNHDDGVTFLCIPWRGLEECGYDVKTVEGVFS